MSPTFTAFIANPLPPNPLSFKSHSTSLRQNPRPVTVRTKRSGPVHALFGSPSVTKDSLGLTVIDVPGMSRHPTPLWQLGLLTSLLVYIWRRVTIRRHLKRPYRRSNLSQDIANFYDLRSSAWESVWGEHMHHGLYDKVDGNTVKGVSAQIRTMSQLLQMANLLDLPLPKHPHILDVGCGIGGASRYLARHFGPYSKVTGITLSPYQADRANQINKQQGLADRVDIKVQDALQTPFPDNSFDIVWSLESGEHMEDKQKFLKECHRVLKPGGKIIMLAWCIRETNPPLKISERFSIRRIMEEYCLPRVAPASEYTTGLIRSGVRKVTVSDWTKRAAPFWGEVVRSAIFNIKGWIALFKYGWPLIRSALAMRHVISGIKQGVFRLVAFSGSKPTQQEAEEEARSAMQCCSKSSLPVKV